MLVIPKHNVQQLRRPSVREELCRHRFDNWLQTNGWNLHGFPPSISWSIYEPRGPWTSPDYFLTLDGKEFAVEITAVMHHKRVGDSDLSVQGIWNGQRDLVKAAEEVCLARKILEGVYFVAFNNAVPNLWKLSKLWTRTLDELVTYITDTVSDFEAPKREIILSGVHICTIEKSGNYANCLCYAHSMDFEPSSGSLPLHDRLKAAVSRKAESLDKALDDAVPLILLLDEQYCREQPHVWYDCLDNHPAAAKFHTIYVVRDTAYDFAIWVGEVGWPVLHPNSDTPY